MGVEKSGLIIRSLYRGFWRNFVISEFYFTRVSIRGSTSMESLKNEKKRYLCGCPPHIARTSSVHKTLQGVNHRSSSLVASYFYKQPSEFSPVQMFFSRFHVIHRSRAITWPLSNVTLAIARTFLSLGRRRDCLVSAPTVEFARGFHENVRIHGRIGFPRRMRAAARSPGASTETRRSGRKVAARSSARKQNKVQRLLTSVEQHQSNHQYDRLPTSTRPVPHSWRANK